MMDPSGPKDPPVIIGSPPSSEEKMLLPIIPLVGKPHRCSKNMFQQKWKDIADNKPKRTLRRHRKMPAESIPMKGMRPNPGFWECMSEKMIDENMN
jgi:hypothetical protein